MGGDLARIGEYAVASWARREKVMEKRLDDTAHIMSRAVAAVDASGQFPRLADASDEAVRQFEHGSIALLMNLTPLAADAARRVLEVVFFTAFMRADPARLAAWHAGAEEFRFTQPLKQYFSAARAGVSTGPYGYAPTLALYKRLSASVHANPSIWSESRDRLKIEAQSPKLAAREEMLHDSARSAVYVILHELPELEIDGVEDLSIRHALDLSPKRTRHMKRQNWRVIERMHELFLEVVESVLNHEEDGDNDGEIEDEADAEAAIALAYPLVMRGLGYALELLGKPERRTFRRLKLQLSLIVPPLSRDYTDLFNEVRNFSKKVTYFEEDIEILESLESIADEVNRFIDEIRTMAIAAGDAPG